MAYGTLDGEGRDPWKVEGKLGYGAGSASGAVKIGFGLPGVMITDYLPPKGYICIIWNAASETRRLVFISQYSFSSLENYFRCSSRLRRIQFSDGAYQFIKELKLIYVAFV